MKSIEILILAIAVGLVFLTAEQTLALYGVELAAPSSVSLADAPRPLVLTGGEVRHGSYVSDDNIAVLSHTFDGVLQMIDVSDPERPRRGGHMYYPGFAGLFIFDLPNASQVPAGKVSAQ